MGRRDRHAAALRVTVLGGFGLSHDDEPLPPIASRVGRSMLAYLILNRDRVHPRDRIADIFWPNLPDARSRRRVSHTLWQIQDVLGELPGDRAFLLATPDTLSINPDARIEVDAAEFEAQVERFRPGRSPVMPRARDLAALEAAVDRYGGDLLAGYEDDWLVVERERYAQLHLDALGWLIELAKGQGAYEDALLYARRLTHHDPLREDGHREVMRLCTLLGRSSEAMLQYERCRSVLAEELGTEPSRATMELVEFIDRQRAHGQAPHTPAEQPDPVRADLRLVGRNRERAVLVDALERALAGRGTHVLVEGDPGLGKTRLLRQAAEDARWRGFTVLRGGAEVGADLPYLPLAEALQSELTPVRIEQLRPRVDAVWLQEVGRVIPQLGRAIDSPSARLPDGGSADRMQEAFARVIAALCELDPVALLLEDLHDADAETLQVLARIARRLPEQRLCVMLSYRGEEARSREPVWATLRALDAAGVPDRVMLQPLDPFGTAELVRESLPSASAGALAARLHAETGGNPLFALETLRALREQQLSGFEGVDDLPLPGTIRELVTARLRGLPDDAQVVLSSAAVQAVGLHLDTLIRAVGGDGDADAFPAATARVGDAVRELLRRGLLIEDDEGYRFRHEQVRRVVVDLLDADQRAVVHGRVAAALMATRPTNAAEIARHLDAAGSATAAVDAYRTAARQALEVDAYLTAQAQLGRAVELQQRGPVSLGARALLLAEYESVLSVLGERDRQEEVIAELETVAGDAPGMAADAARRRAWLAAHTDRFDDAEHAAGRAYDLARDEAERGSALTVLGTARLWRGAHQAAVEALEQAVGALVGHPDEAAARVALAEALSRLQQYDAANTELTTARELQRDVGDLTGEARTLAALATVRMETGDAEAAAENLSAALDRCRRIGYRYGEGVNLVNLANCLYAISDVGGALARYDEAREVFHSLDDQRGLAMVQLNSASVRHVILGDDDRARQDSETALRYFRSIGDERMAALCSDTIAGIAIRRCQPEQARVILDEALAEVGDSGDVWPVVHLLRTRAELALSQGDPDTAESVAARALDLCRDRNLTDLAVSLQGTIGLARLDQERPNKAFEATSDAVAGLHPGTDRSYQTWWAHHLAARATGRWDVAQHALDHAVAALQGALASLSPEMQDRSLETVRLHADIMAALDAMTPREVRLWMAGSDVPAGRPITPAERQEVLLRIDLPRTDDQVAWRRSIIPQLVDQAAGQGAIPTVRDLADALDVSVSTIRRDLHALRQVGVEVSTRGARSA